MGDLPLHHAGERRVLETVAAGARECEVEVRAGGALGAGPGEDLGSPELELARAPGTGRLLGVTLRRRQVRESHVRPARPAETSGGHGKDLLVRKAVMGIRLHLGLGGEGAYAGLPVAAHDPELQRDSWPALPAYEIGRRST